MSIFQGFYTFILNVCISRKSEVTHPIFTENYMLVFLSIENNIIDTNFKTPPISKRAKQKKLSLYYGSASEKTFKVRIKWPY